MATLTLESVRKRYGREDVIHGVDVEIADRELVVVVGPSGCGKSTLLRMIAGLETVTEGEIRIDGERVNEREPMDRNIAMVFQNYALYPHMSVFDNMAYALKIARRPKDEIERRVREAARLLELEDYLGRKPRQLSGGQRQRVAMGRAIVREPAVFLFDEPLSNLDAKLRVQMRLEIKSLQRRLGVTSVYVTHDQVEAMTLGDRLMVLNAGHVEQFGTPIELYQRPATAFVAGFIGSPSMNLLPARVENGVAVLEADGTRLPIDVEASGELTVGLRPEHLVVDADGPLALDVGAIEQLGASTLVHGTLAGSTSAFSASLPGVRRESELASPLPLRPAASDAVHLFERGSGLRIG